MAVEPVPDEAAAVADLADGRALVIADYHAGLEVALRYDGVEVRSQADRRRTHLVGLLDRTGVDRLVILGDFANAIGDPGDEERREIESLLDTVTDRVPVTVVKGNHDGEIEAVVSEYPAVEVTPGHGIRDGDVGFAHGHTWPSPDVLAAETVCVAHEHPTVKLEDEVGGTRVERAWLRGSLGADPFESQFPDRDLGIDGDLIVFPAFNDLTGGTWVNVRNQEFLSPFLPEALVDGEAYLLDGTRLGAYRQV